MLKNCITILSILFFFACTPSKKTQNPSSANLKVDQKELSEKENTLFGRTYIDASTQKLLGNYKEALNLFAQAINIDPSNSAPYYESAIILSGLKNDEDALVLIKKAIELEPDNYWYNSMYANLLEEKGKIDEALTVYKKLSEENPEKIELKYELAKLYFYNKEYERSIQVLNDIEDKIGVSEEISILKQKTYLNLNDVDKAANEIRLLIKAFPNEYNFYVQLADIYMSNNREEDALKVYEELNKLDKDNASAQLAMADYYRLKGESDQSYEALLKAMGNKGLDIDVKVKYMLTFYQVNESNNKKKEQAVELTKIIAETHTDNAKAHAMYGDFLFFSDSLEKAKIAYEKTIAIDSSRFPVWSQLMLLLSQMNDMKALENYGERGIHLFPNQPTLYLFYGSALAQQKKHEKAVEYLKMGSNLVVDNKPLLSQFHSTLGDSYHALKDSKNSDKHYEKALELDPNNVYVLNNYSYYLSVREENLERARQMSEKSNMLAPGQASFQDTYGWILYKLGKYEEANEWISKALQSSEQSGVILEHKGDVLFQLGKISEAVEFWEKAKKTGGASELIDKKIVDKKLYE